MGVAVIADAHIGGPGGGPEPLVEQIDGLAAAGCDHLVLLGDLFQVWVGDRRYETPAIRAVVDAVGRLRRQGARVDYVEGNRDFFIASSEYARIFDRVADEVAFEAGGRRYLAVHGDGLDPADRQYRFWRALSKSRLSRLGARWLPAALARPAVLRTERRLADTNFKHKIEIPRQVILDYGRRRLAEGHDVLLLGHYHDPRSWPIDGGRVEILDAWFNDRRIHWLDRADAAAGGPVSG